MPIPEIQKLKEKYPVYKDHSDSILLEALVKAYPAYKPIADREFGVIKKREVGVGEKVLDYMTKGLVDEETKKLYSGVKGPEVIPLVGLSTVAWASRQIDRVSGTIRGLVTLDPESAGPGYGPTKFVGPIKGFLHPEKAPSTEFSKILGIKDKVQAKWVDAAADTIVNLGAFHLAFNTIPRAVIGVSNAARGLYSGKQGKKLTRLKGLMVDELTRAGVPQEAATKYADAEVAIRWGKAGKLGRTPSAIRNNIKIMEANKGKFAEEILRKANAAKASAAARPEETKAVITKLMEGPEASVQAPVKPITQVVKLKYKGVPKTVAKTLPNEVIGAEVTPMVQKTISKFPKKITDQKSLEEVGNAIAKDMGIVAKIDWKFKTIDKRGISGVHFVKEYKELKPGVAKTPEELISPLVKKHSITIRLGLKGIDKVEAGSPLGKRRPELIGKPYSPSQGRIKKLVLHEISHITAPPELGVGKRKIHHTIFDDEVDYYKESSLIKREMRKAQAPVVSSKIEQAAPPQPTPELPITKDAVVKAPVEPPRLGVPIKVKPEIAVKPQLEKSWDEAKSILANYRNKDTLRNKFLDLDPDISSPRLDKLVDGTFNQWASSIAKAKKLGKDKVLIYTPEEVLKGERTFRPAYNVDTDYHVEYNTLSGIKQTTMSGVQLNDIDKALFNNQIPKDSSNSAIMKLNEVLTIRGSKAGFVDIGHYTETLTNVMGKVEVASSDFKKHAKIFGTPFFIGQKYPSFKPIYMAIQEGVDYKNELFFEGARILNPHQILKLPESSKKKVADVIKLGNSPTVERWFNPEELKVKFGMNDAEINAYNRIRRLYKYSTNIEVESRKMLGSYQEASPAQKKILDEQINQRVAKLGGYVSQSRFLGDWAVYSPPKKEGDIAKFFNLYKNKAEAEKAAEALGADASVYLRKNISRDLYRHLNVVDLENLIEAAGVDTSSTAISELRNELRKKTFSAHWIRRQNVPGYDWTLNNITESAIDYLEGAANKLARVKGRQGAEAAFRSGVKDMPPELRVFTRDYLESFYNTGTIGFRALNRLVYTWKLAFKVSWLAQNLTQPLATTYPAMSQYFSGLETEKVFGSSYGMAARYLAFRMKGSRHGLSSDLVYSLGKLHRQGVLGDQLTRFQLGVKNLGKENFEKWIGLFGRIGEGINRTHAAIIGHRIATTKLGLTDRVAIIEFMKEFVYKTQFAYGKQNLPLVITGSGNIRNFVKTAYTFRHFSVSFLQLVNSMMPWRGAPTSQTMRALGSILAQGGIKGLPFFALIAAGYKYFMGRTLDHDIRKGLSDMDVPGRVIDLGLHGAYSEIGIDASSLIGLGDVISTYGGAAQVVGGAVVGMGQQMFRGVESLSKGDYKRAVEDLSPDVLRNILKGYRYAKEGMRKKSGELIATPSQRDAVLRAIGFQSMTESKAYGAREAKQTILKRRSRVTSFYAQKMAQARGVGNHQEVNRLRAEAKAKYNIIITGELLRTWIKKRKGTSKQGVPRRMKRKVEEVDKLFGIKGKEKIGASIQLR